MVTARLRPPLQLGNPTMNDNNDIEDVESKQDYVEAFGGCSIGDADTAEGQARRAEEAHLEGWDIEPPEGDLPTREEADLGQLFRVKTPFEGLELVDSDTPDLIGAIIGDDGSDKASSEATDQEVREAVEDLEDDGRDILGEIEAEMEAFRKEGEN